MQEFLFLEFMDQATMQVLLYTDNSKEKGSKKMDNKVSSIVEAIKKYSVETPNQLCIADKKRQATYKEF